MWAARGPGSHVHERSRSRAAKELAVTVQSRVAGGGRRERDGVGDRDCIRGIRKTALRVYDLLFIPGSPGMKRAFLACRLQSREAL